MHRYGLIVILGVLIWTQPIGAQVCPLDSRIKPKGVGSLDSFQKIAVLEDGRIKPLDTYSRNVLLRFSGRRTFNRRPAVEWLGRLLLAPDCTREDKIFLINNPEIPMALGIAPEEGRRYSSAQVEPVFLKLHELAFKAAGLDPKSRTIVEEEIIRLEANVRFYVKLSQSFKFAALHPGFTLEDPQLLRQLELPEGQNQFSFLDIALRADQIRIMIQDLEAKNQNQWSDSERAIVSVLAHLYQWSLVYRDLPLHVIPSVEPSDESWLSPWDAVGTSFPNSTIRREISLLRDMLAAYWNGNQFEFDLAARGFSDSVQNRVPFKVKQNLRMIPWELLYNRWQLFFYAKFLYFAAFLVFLWDLVANRRILKRSAFLLVTAGFVFHLAALLLRIMIMGRPPVTNLYETFIFVGFVSGLLGLIVEWFHKMGLGLVVASVCGFVFLTIAEKFSAEGDTMRMLVAVLNSNFWLGTHVVSITTGYAGVCVAGILGYGYILQGLARPHEKKQLEATSTAILGVLGFGLIMTFLGTNLGGIWADQSWGRFWGWDPKENGALLIVLWCAILFHAKIAEMIGPLGMAVGCVLGTIVVGWAWFGVNLLSVGLHSYGFTSGAAAGLAVYVISQLVFLGITVPLFKRRNLINVTKSQGHNVTSL